MAIGIACSILIFMFVYFERSFDRYHEKSDRIYRVALRAMGGGTKINQTYSSAITFRQMLEDFPEIETGVKFLKLGRTSIKNGDKIFTETRLFAVDSTFFDVFSVPLIQGNTKTVLTEPNTMVVTRSTALKVFGETEVVGRFLTTDLSGGQKISFAITGVSGDMPPNSHFHYDMLVSSMSFPEKIDNSNWSANDFISYIVLKQGVSQKAFDQKVKSFTRNRMGAEMYDAWVAQGNYWEYFLQPVTDIHLHSDLDGEFEANGNAAYVTISMLISVFILLIACFNFMNLATAKSSLRAKEVSLRKVVGADKRRLVVRFLSESFLLCFIALVLGILLVELMMPSFRSLMVRPLRIQYFHNAYVIPALLMLWVTVGVIAGSYPAFVLSSFAPVTVLKGHQGERKRGQWLRNILIVLQFAISIFLIIGMQTIYRQLRLSQNIELGFDRRNVLVVSNPGATKNDVALFKENLKGHVGIIDVTGSNTLPGLSFVNTGFGAEGGEKDFSLNTCLCDHHFLNTLRLKLAQGRFFSENFRTDSATVVLNQKAVALLGWNDPVGKVINDWEKEQRVFKVVGVIEDYHYESLHHEIRPMGLFLSGAYDNHAERYISIRFNPFEPSSILKEVENEWNKLETGIPFEYFYLKNNYDNLYNNEVQTRNFFLIFTVLAVFIASLGLLGLTSFVTEQKTKEIGVRKVLGATVPGIVRILSVSFIKWVLAANLLAWPAAYFTMNRWLQNFAYRVSPRMGEFFLAGCLVCVIAFMTISIQTVQAAIANPVDALKYE